MSDTFVTTDRRLAVVLTEGAKRRLLAHCVRAGTDETGGILIGRYSRLLDQAIVSEVTGPPVDSVRRRWSFVRGLAGMQRRIDRAWRRQDFYLGEWHFHPFMSANPSPQDRQQIIDFAADPAYACPEPVLLIVGGDPASNFEMTVTIVMDGELVRLSRPSTERAVGS